MTYTPLTSTVILMASADTFSNLVLLGVDKSYDLKRLEPGRVFKKCLVSNSGDGAGLPSWFSNPELFRKLYGKGKADINYRLNGVAPSGLELFSHNAYNQLSIEAYF
jgi:hypothetical protein